MGGSAGGESDAADGAPTDLTGLQGLPRGPLGGGRVLFRGQLFYQELLPEHVACCQLEFRIGLGDDRRNLARVIASTASGGGGGVAAAQAKDAREVVPDDDPRLLQAAMCGPGREDEAEVVKMLRAAASWGGHLRVRRLLASCFVHPRACGPALYEAAKFGHEDVVSELLRARAPPSAVDAGAAGKTALHIACEQGHEAVATLLLQAGADLATVDGSGLTALDLAREQDLGPMVRRLEKVVAAASA